MASVKTVPIAQAGVALIDARKLCRQIVKIFALEAGIACLQIECPAAEAAIPAWAMISCASG